MKRDISIFDIMIDKIEPHPQNPRKDLGDLTELCRSIEENGIMQNLTVVPLDDENKRFRCVIGHRRLAAAKKIGLPSVPATIAWDMDEKEQIATMIAENMQRADLTIPEQAQAVQMMLDLGEGFEQISDRTGLSQSTVRRRAKLASYDQKALEKACKRGASLFDLEKIDKIEDPELQQKALEAAGTQGFERIVQDAISAQKRVKEFQKIAEILDKFATKTNKYNGIYCANIYNMSAVSNYGLETDKGIEAFKKKYPEDAVFTYAGDGPFYVYYTSPKSSKEKKEKEIAAKCEKERGRRIEEQEKILSRRRMEFLAQTIADGDVIMTPELIDMIKDKIEGSKGWYLEQRIQAFKKLAEEYDAGERMKDPIVRIALILYADTAFGLSWNFTHGDSEIDENHKKAIRMLESFGYVQKQDEIDFYDKKSDCFRKLTVDDLGDESEFEEEEE